MKTIYAHLALTAHHFIDSWKQQDFSNKISLIFQLIELTTKIEINTVNKYSWNDLFVEEELTTDSDVSTGIPDAFGDLSGPSGGVPGSFNGFSGSIESTGRIPVGENRDQT